jgi:ribonuclease-3
VGKNEMTNKFNDSPVLLCDVFESLVGALYLDGGAHIAEDLLIKAINIYLSENNNLIYIDYKSQLQRYSTKKFKCLPIYKTIREYGPEHNKTYLIEVRLPSQNLVALGKGKKKKIAEKIAAKNLINKFHINAI